MQIEEVRSLVRDRIHFLRAERGADEVIEYADIDNFFDLGLIDSLEIVELVQYVETLIESTIDFGEVDPEEFFSVEGIARLIVDRSATDVPDVSV